MSSIYFYSQKLDFKNYTGDPYDFIYVSASHEFDSDVMRGEVALKGFDAQYTNNNLHYINECGAQVINVQCDGNTISCDVGIKINNGADATIDANQSSAEILYIAVCE